MPNCLRPRIAPIIVLIATAAAAALSLAPTASAQRSVVTARTLLSRTASGAGAGANAAPRARSAADNGANGWTPADLHSAYALPDTGPKGVTIAVVVAYDAPSAQSDLAQYDSAFSIASCTPSNHCFRKVNQDGNASPLPGADPTGGTWLTEASLSTQVARGVCQNCSILLVEANGADSADLATAVNTASRLGAQVIVTSFTPPEQSGDSTTYAADYDHPKSVVVAATGDLGYTGGTPLPASLPNVVAVGGTQLTLSKTGKYVSETAWSQGGSGCSLYTAAPIWQAGLDTGCAGKRSIADISAVAFPGALVHITGIPGSPPSWYDAAGTSLSAPIIGGAFGLAGGGSSSSAQLLYEHARKDPSAFRDVTTGTTSGYCVNQPYCAARPGYDGPTGLGTPDGLAAFLNSGGTLATRHPDLAVTVPKRGLHAGGQWHAVLALQNRNPFSLTVSASLRSAQRIRIGTRLGTRLETITFAAAAELKLGSLAAGKATFTVAKRYRALLRRLHSVQVIARITLRRPVGRAVTISRPLRLYAP